MKTKRILAALLSAIIAAAFATTASAIRLTEVVYPSEKDPVKNDAYYALSASGYYINGFGKSYQGEEIGIDSDGMISVEFKIDAFLPDPSMSGKGSLEEMGIIIHNVDRAFYAAGFDLDVGYPVEMHVADAKYVDDDGNETVFNDMLNITEMQRDPEGDVAFRIRPTDKTDEGTGDVLVSATREVTGWDQEGAFNGGTLYFTVELGSPAKDEDPPSVGGPYKIGIKDQDEETTLGYKEDHIFTADIQNLPDGAEIRWFVNGQSAGNGDSCTVKRPTDDYTVQAKLIDKDGNVIAESDLVNVNVKNDLFAKIKYILTNIYYAIIIVIKIYF